jgi:tRNA A37 threonylcarbamoyladenosine dehydratase
MHSVTTTLLSNDPADAGVDPESGDQPSLAGGDFPESDGYLRRFGGVARIYGDKGLARLDAARVAVVGVGGVGSWVVEALARSAVGSLTLIDLDNVSESNINRQLQALSSTIGQAKIQALTARIAEINPRCTVNEVEDFLDPDNVAALLPAGAFDFVVDAMDDKKAKVALAVHARATGVPLVVVGSAGGQRDPTRVQVADLARTEHDPLLARVRKQLRTDHGFARNLKTKFGIAAVFSDEPVAQAIGQDGNLQAGGLNCAGYGSSVAVTAVFGFVAASVVLNVLSAKADPQPHAHQKDSPQ